MKIGKLLDCHRKKVQQLNFRALCVITPGTEPLCAVRTVL